MFSLLRLSAASVAVYAFFLLAFPQWGGQVYHVATLSIIAGGAVAMWMLLKVLDLGSTVAKLAVEAAFVLAVALFVGYTLPQKNGLPAPIEQWAAGHKPTRSDVRDGLTRLGVDANRGAGALVVSLFPK